MTLEEAATALGEYGGTIHDRVHGEVQGSIKDVAALYAYLTIYGHGKERDAALQEMFIHAYRNACQKWRRAQKKTNAPFDAEALQAYRDAFHATLVEAYALLFVD